jgi:hypothetical protein
MAFLLKSNYEFLTVLTFRAKQNYENSLNTTTKRFGKPVKMSLKLSMPF